MYYAAVVILMFAFPLLSIRIEAVHGAAPLSLALVGKWFAFWSVGVRLLLAGLRQVFQPMYTAREILGLEGSESLILVRELGFANLAIGSVGVLSLLVPSWRLAAAVAGGVFYGLAGINHARQPHRNRLENVAMVSDVFVAVVLLSVCVGGRGT